MCFVRYYSLDFNLLVLNFILHYSKNIVPTIICSSIRVIILKINRSCNILLRRNMLIFIYFILFPFTELDVFTSQDEVILTKVTGASLKIPCNAPTSKPKVRLTEI